MDWLEAELLSQPDFLFHLLAFVVWFFVLCRRVGRVGEVLVSWKAQRTLEKATVGVCAAYSICMV